MYISEKGEGIHDKRSKRQQTSRTKQYFLLKIQSKVIRKGE